MIRFGCPTCRSVLESPERKAGDKIACPKCGQRLQVPAPPRNKTVLGTIFPEPSGQFRPVDPPVRDPQPQATVANSVSLTCPTCKAVLSLPRTAIGFWTTCPKCREGFLASDDSTPEQPVEPPRAIVLSRPNDDQPSGKHSGLGIASFLIATLVGGMDAILLFIVTTGIARSAHQGQSLEMNFLAGGVSLYCLNCASLPLCIVGVGLAVTGMVANKSSRHFFTWIGLVGNGTVILGMLGYYLFGALTGK